MCGEEQIQIKWYYEWDECCFDEHCCYYQSHWDVLITTRRTTFNMMVYMLEGTMKWTDSTMMMMINYIINHHYHQRLFSRGFLF